MNRATAAKYLHAITAFALGETIEYRVIGGAGWKTTENPLWDDTCEYRIKPKAEEFFAVYDLNDRRLAICFTYRDADSVRKQNPGSYIKTYVEQK